jgi:hypothetical protein
LSDSSSGGRKTVGRDSYDIGSRLKGQRAFLGEHRGVGFFGLGQNDLVSKVLQVAIGNVGKEILNDRSVLAPGGGDD